MTKQTVFLSYARADDEPFVRKLHNDLKTLGIEAWYDRENMTADGSPFTQAIGDAIRASQRVLFKIKSLLILSLGIGCICSPVCLKACV